MTVVNSDPFSLQNAGAPVASRVSSAFRKLAAVGILGFSATLCWVVTYAVALAFYYWPILQFKLSAIQAS